MYSAYLLAIIDEKREDDETNINALSLYKAQSTATRFTERCGRLRRCRHSCGIFF